jgi:TP901 family phage tail tape measure protein
VTSGSPMDLTIRAALHDELSGPIRDITEQLKKLNQQVKNSGSLAGQSTRSINDYGSGFGRVGRLARKATSEVVNFARYGVLAGAGVLAVAAKKIYNVGKAYQDSLNTFQAVTSATGKQMAAAAKEARALGQDMSLPATSAADAAAAMTELAKGGLSVSSSMIAAKGTLQLATAAQIDAAAAATIQVNALNQFGLSAKQASHVADLLANTANASSGEITDMASALNYFGPVARDFGVSIDSASTALGILGNQGILGSQAGTSLRGALVNLAKPTRLAKQGISELNLQLFDQKGHFLGLRALTDQLAQAQLRMNPRQFNAALAKTFGKENLAAIAALAAAGPRAYDKMGLAVGKVGGAADVAKAKTKGLGGAVAGLKSQLETVAIDIYTKAQPYLEKWVRGFADRIPALEKTVMGQGKSFVGQVSALYQAGKTGNSKWAGLSLANMFGGTQKEWTNVLKIGGRVAGDLTKIFTQGILPGFKTAGQVLKPALLVFPAMLKLLDWMAKHPKVVSDFAATVVLLATAWKFAAAMVRLYDGALAAANALSKNPWTVAIAALVAIGLGSLYAYKHWTWFHKAVDSTAHALVVAFQHVKHWVEVAWGAMKQAWHWLQKAWKTDPQMVEMRDEFKKLWSVLVDIKNVFMDIVSSVTWLETHVNGALSSALNGFTSGVNSFAGGVNDLAHGKNPFGDTATPKARGGNLGSTMGAASAINSRVPGNRQVTSSYRTHGLGSSKSDHVTGRALDLIGTNLQGYAAAVRKSGGFAQFHGNAEERHLHVALGGPGGRGSMPEAPGPYGDTSTPQARFGGSTGSGGFTVLPGGITILVQGAELTPDDVSQATLRAIKQYEQDRAERT